METNFLDAELSGAKPQNRADKKNEVRVTEQVSPHPPPLFAFCCGATGPTRSQRRPRRALWVPERENPNSSRNGGNK